MTEAFAYWVREFGIDGFRADAAWGVRERAPEFWPRLRDELKRIDPDLLLLAEASARDPFYDIAGFDAAYDWTHRLGEWAWRDAFEEGGSTAARLRTTLIGSRARRSPAAPMPRSGALVFRFLNNNDTGERFVTRYGVARTRLAATMLLTLPGLPLLYTGDEIGAEFEPYDGGAALSWAGAHGLRERCAPAAWPSAASMPFFVRSAWRCWRRHIPRACSPMCGRASSARTNFIVLLNYHPQPVRAALPLSTLEGTAALVDLLSGEAIPIAPDLRAIDLPGWGARVLRRGTAPRR